MAVEPADIVPRVQVWSEELGAGYEAFRAQIEHEDHLVGMRISWLMAAEAFLFAAYAAALVVPSKTAASSMSIAAYRLFRALPWVGIVLALLVLIAVWAAILRLHQLRTEFGDDVGSIKDFPAITSETRHRLLGRVPGVLAPAVVIAAWCYVKW
jgi:hypothetical protein